jgi:hypothetical protein
MACSLLCARSGDGLNYSRFRFDRRDSHWSAQDSPDNFLCWALEGEGGRFVEILSREAGSGF